MRYGISVAFTYAYYGNSEYFQTDMVSTAFGISNTTARLSTIVSPMVAEVLSQPIILITLCTFVSSIVSFFLNKPQNILGIKDIDPPQASHENEVQDVLNDFYGINNKESMPKEEQKIPDDLDDTKEFNENEFKRKSSKKEKFVIMDDDNDDDENDPDQI
mmetsp:Transcript_16879/g.14800  ORF Transcript_16879/g.14800 Transcript_16879/m.14800 type:complete len:160 (+) Transcript_16879:1081-1560(+)